MTAHVSIDKQCEYTQGLQSELIEVLSSLGLDACNYTNHPDIHLWRKIYQDDFKVNPKTYKSSIDALVRRILTNKSLWNISNIVDLYNYCSVKYLLPMGGYDLMKIKGEIQIRYGKDNEDFQAIGQTKTQPVTPHHIVYADQEKILCWLWNHKDSLFSCIDEETKEAIFFIDSADVPHHFTVEEACQGLKAHLQNIGSQVHKMMVLDRHHFETEV